MYYSVKNPVDGIEILKQVQDDFTIIASSLWIEASSQ
jgi:hypothetical protein